MLPEILRKLADEIESGKVRADATLTPLFDGVEVEGAYEDLRKDDPRRTITVRIVDTEIGIGDVAEKVTCPACLGRYHNQCCTACRGHGWVVRRNLDVQEAQAR